MERIDGWDEYIGRAEKKKDSTEKTVFKMLAAYEIIKALAEQEVRTRLTTWLEKAPKVPRTMSNAFLMLSRGANIQGAYTAIDAGMAHIALMATPKSMFTVPQGMGPADVRNIYEGMAIIRKETLGMLDELELAHPDEAEDIDVVRGMVEDNKLNIEGVITRDGRQIKEMMLRSITGEQPVATIKQAISNWNINPAYFELSTVAHPRAYVRATMYESVKRTPDMFSEHFTDIGKISWIVLPSKDGYSTAVDEVLSYRIFTSQQLDALCKKRSADTRNVSDWRGIGFGYNTNEYYFPIRREWLEDAVAWSKKRRGELAQKVA